MTAPALPTGTGSGAARVYAVTCRECGVAFTARYYRTRYCPTCKSLAARRASVERAARGVSPVAEPAMPAAEVASRMDWQALQEVLPAWRRAPWPGSVERARVEMVRLRKEMAT